MSTKEYQKKTGYAAQKKYRAAHYSNIVIALYKERKEELVRLAAAKGVSLSRLVIGALESQYGIDLSKPPENENENEMR